MCGGLGGAWRWGCARPFPAWGKSLGAYRVEALQSALGGAGSNVPCPYKIALSVLR